MPDHLKVPLKNPKLNFEEFRRVIKGEKRANKVHFVELLFDPEIISFIIKNFLGEEPITWSSETRKKFLKQRINFWYRMGYDYARIVVGDGIQFSSKARKTEDTALLSRGERNWVEEGKGIISSWGDFEEYPWPNPDKVNYSLYEFTAKNLPDGMKMMVCPCSGVLEVSSESLLGFEGMSYLLYDNPGLVKAVFDKVGQVIYGFYKNIVELDGVGGFFQVDDM